MPFLTTAGYLLLLSLGLGIFIFGLLHAAHPPFQRWWYGTRWYNPDRKGPVDVVSNDYKSAILNMKMAGSRAALIGALLAIFSLAQLGFLD